MKSTPHLLIEIVSNYFRVPVSDVISTCRDAEFVRARQVSMYFIRDKFKMSLSQTGSYFQGKNNNTKDHATVLHAIRNVTKKIDKNPKYKKEVELISLLLADPALLNDEPIKTDQNLHYQNQRLKDENTRIRTALSLTCIENKSLRSGITSLEIQITSLKLKLDRQDALKVAVMTKTTPVPAKSIKPAEKGNPKYSNIQPYSHEYKPYLSHIF